MGKMRYTATSGIWQPVWIEAVEACHIKKLRLTPDIDEKSLAIKTTASGEYDCSLKVTVTDDDSGETVVSETIPLDGKIYFDKINLWSPEAPFL